MLPLSSILRPLMQSLRGHFGTILGKGVVRGVLTNRLRIGPKWVFLGS